MSTKSNGGDSEVTDVFPVEKALCGSILSGLTNEQPWTGVRLQRTDWGEFREERSSIFLFPSHIVLLGRFATVALRRLLTGIDGYQYALDELARSSMEEELELLASIYPTQRPRFLEPAVGQTLPPVDIKREFVADELAAEA